MLAPVATGALQGGFVDERRDIIARAIDALPDDLKVPFSLRYSDAGLNNREIAEALNISMSEVQALLNRAFDFLRPTLEAYEPRFAVLEPSPGSLRVTGVKRVVN